MGRPPRPALDRFWDMVSMSPGCWEWVAGKDRDGYGQFQGDGHVRAHRYSYATFIAPIPDGLQVLHRCDNPPCVNPEHLWVGTGADNMADKCAKGRLNIRPAIEASAAKRGAKTHCVRGHEFTPENTYSHGGSRYCRACKNERQRKAYGNEGT